MSTELEIALMDECWLNHKIGNNYTMDGSPELWKIAYYPIFEDGKTLEVYKEPRALIERQKTFNGIDGIDFREVPLRYLKLKP